MTNPLDRHAVHAAYPAGDPRPRATFDHARRVAHVGVVSSTLGGLTWPHVQTFQVAGCEAIVDGFWDLWEPEVKLQTGDAVPSLHIAVALPDDIGQSAEGLLWLLDTIRDWLQAECSPGVRLSDQTIISDAHEWSEDQHLLLGIGSTQPLAYTRATLDDAFGLD